MCVCVCLCGASVMYHAEGEPQVPSPPDGVQNNSQPIKTPPRVLDPQPQARGAHRGTCIFRECNFSHRDSRRELRFQVKVPQMNF